MAKNDLKVKPEEIKKWAGDIVQTAKTTISETVDNIKEGSEEISRKQHAAKEKKELLHLRPVFKETLIERPSPNCSTLTPFGRFRMPTMIHVVEKDKKHKNSPFCEHALGHLSVENGVEVLNVYPHHMKDLGVKFYPDMGRKIYYVHPFQKDIYIDIEDYFHQLKTAKVDELERIAYDLGAKHAEIIFRTDKVELENEKQKAELGAKKGKKKIVDVKAEHNQNELKKESLVVEKTINLGGHDDPHEPDLIYFKEDEDIKNLIYMRMDPKNKLKNKECKIKCSNSSEIKSSDAAKIQGALDKMGGVSAGFSLMSETLEESCTTLIYKIEF